jgi:hypothetical protein
MVRVLERRDFLRQDNSALTKATETGTIRGDRATPSNDRRFSVLFRLSRSRMAPLRLAWTSVASLLLLVTFTASAQHQIVCSGN